MQTIHEWDMITQRLKDEKTQDWEVFKRMRKERGLTVPYLEPHKMERVALSAAFTKFVSQYIFFLYTRLITE